MKKLLTFFVLLIVIPMSIHADVFENRDELLNLSVMINAELAGKTSYGTGFIVGSNESLIYIATSGHLVREKGKIKDVDATEINIEFKQCPSEKFPARLLPFKNWDLDLAMLRIDVNQCPNILKNLKLDLIGQSSSLKFGDNLYLLGNPNGESWTFNPDPYKFNKKDINLLMFAASSLEPGYSGGLLIDSNGLIVGQISRHSAPNGNAYPIELIIETIKNNNFPVNLKPGKMKTAGSSESKNFTEMLPGDVPLEMVFVEGNYNSEGVKPDEAINDLYIGKYELTEAQWKAVMGEPSMEPMGPNYPAVFDMTQDAAIQFCEKLSQLTGRRYRLLSENEWIYAAKGGLKSRGFTYSGNNNIDLVACYIGTSDGRIEVGQKEPNELGLFDMSGNVAEICFIDIAGQAEYVDEEDDGTAYWYSLPACGGDWGSAPQNCKIGCTHINSAAGGDIYGFRVAVSATK